MFFFDMGGTRKRIRQQETKSLAARQIPVGNKIQEEELCGKLLKKMPARKHPVFKPARSPGFQIGARTSLVELLDERDPSTGDFLILQYTKKRHGKQRGIRMIHKASLLAFLRSRAEEQCRRKFASDVQNPDGVSVEQVCADFDLFVRPLLGLVGYPRP